MYPNYKKFQRCKKNEFLEASLNVTRLKKILNSRERK